MIENWGTHLTVIISQFFVIIGFAMRVLINQNFYFAIFGTLIAALGRACSMHAPTKVSVNWFLPKNRPIVSSILLLASPLGTIIGSWITIFMVELPKKG